MSTRDDQFPDPTTTKEALRVDPVMATEAPSVAAAPAPRASESTIVHDNRKLGLFERLGQFIRDTRDELRRTSFPTQTEVKNTTIITIIAVVFFAIYLYGVDQLLTFIVGLIERGIDWLLRLFA